MEIQILKEKIPMEKVRELSKKWYDTMIKGTVDTERGLVALGGDYHIESCEILVKSGGKHKNIWGFNINFEEPLEDMLEFDSMINLKPALGNKSQIITDKIITDKCENIIREWIVF